MSFQSGKQAALNGKAISDNPHTDGFTKLGNVRLTEEGIAWEEGFKSAQPARVAGKKEMELAHRSQLSNYVRKVRCG